jgi:hypothetical protein
MECGSFEREGDGEGCEGVDGRAHYLSERKCSWVAAQPSSYHLVPTCTA